MTGAPKINSHSIALRDAIADIGSSLEEIAGSMSDLQCVVGELVLRAGFPADDEILQKAQSIDPLTQAISYYSKIVRELGCLVPEECLVDARWRSADILKAPSRKGVETLSIENGDVIAASGECEFF